MVLATIVIDHLQRREQVVQYHLFSVVHQAKRTIAYFLRSIATQLAITSESFRDTLLEMKRETGLSFTNHNQNFHVIWEKVFEGIIFKHQFPQPLVWVLDAIDEADTPDLLFSRLSQIDSKTPVKIFFSSRSLNAISLFDTLGIRSFFLRDIDTAEDIKAYATRVLRQSLPDDDDTLSYLVSETVKNSFGSFLWAKLVLEALQQNWHTKDAIRQTLMESPLGMIPMYERMLKKIQGQAPKSRNLARRILTWVTCSWHPLRLDELQVALQPEFSNFVKLEDNVTQI